MEHGPAKHLTFGGSTAHRWMRCAGSVRLCATLPPQPESEHMARGTRAHALLETALSWKLETVLNYESRCLDDYPENPFDREDVEAVQVAVDHVNGILAANPDAVMWVEQRVTLADDVGGTADVLIYVPGTPAALHVIDYKHGAGHYVTEHAPQFRFYATCAVMGSYSNSVGVVYATVIQPRCFAGEPVRTAVYGVADMITYADDVEAAVAAALAPDPAFVAGEWCDWCPAAPYCPAHRDDAFSVVTVPDGGARLPVGDEITIRLPPPGECRDPTVLAQTLPALGQIKAWVSAMEGAAYAEAMAGKHIPGHKLVAKRGTRKWAAPDEKVAEWLEYGPGLVEDAVWQKKIVSVAQAEKLLKGNKSAIRDMAALVEKKSSGLKLVAETEPGDPINPLELLAISGGSANDAIT